MAGEPQDLTIIYPVLDFYPQNSTRWIGNSNLNAMRIITILPLHAKAIAPSMKWFRPVSGKPVEHIIAFLGAPGTLEDVPDWRKGWFFSVATLKLLNDCSSLSSNVETTRYSAVGVVEVVEATKLEQETDVHYRSGFAELYDDMYRSTVYNFRNNHRALSWGSWRRELSQEEWRIIKSLPRCCFDTYTVHETAVYSS